MTMHEWFDARAKCRAAEERVCAAQREYDAARRQWSEMVEREYERIAAAPDLLAELEMLTEAIEEMHRNMGEHRCTIDCPDVAKHVASARAAIAKATGVYHSA